MSSPSRFFGIKIIKTKFQFKFSLVVFIFLAVSAGAIWFWGNSMVSKMIESGMLTGDDAIASVNVLRDNIAYISILALAITFGLSLFFSHYIAGPIYRFEKTLEAMRDQGLELFRQVQSQIIEAPEDFGLHGRQPRLVRSDGMVSVRDREFGRLDPALVNMSVDVEVRGDALGCAIERLDPAEVGARLWTNLYGRPAGRCEPTLFEQLDGGLRMPRRDLADELAASAPGHRVVLGRDADDASDLAVRLLRLVRS